METVRNDSTAGAIKLLYIIDCYHNPYAGTEGQLLKLIGGLEPDAFTAKFVVFRNSEYLMRNTFPIPVDVLDVTCLSSPASWIRLFRYFSARKKEGYRLAHIFFNDASIICPPILRLLGYRTIISRRDMGYWYNGLNRLVLKINSLFVDNVVANSKAVKAITMKAENYAANRVKVIYNGYLDADAPAGSLSPGIPLNADSFNIVLVANIRPIKRMEDAIKALGLVRKYLLEVELYIIGDGDQADLRALAASQGVAGAVHFTGPRDDIPQLLPSFDAGILCSESEGFSNTLIEYMQSGLPVICSNVGGNPEIVEHGVNGYLYDAGDVVVLAEYVAMLTGDSDLCSALGKAGADKVRQQYGLAGFLQNHRDLYRSLLDR